MKGQILPAICAALIVICMAACGGTSNSSPGTSTASSGPINSGSPPGGSSSGTSGSGSDSAGSGSGSASGGSNSGGSSGGRSQTAIAYAYVGTVNRSTAGIYGFSVGPDGTATAVPGSPATGPSSYVLTNSAFVFASDSANIASYTRGRDGSLKQSSTTYAVLSNGSEPWAIQAMSLDHTGQTLYAMENAGSDDTYYFFFSIGPDGKITNTGKIGPNVNYVSPLVFSPDNNYAYGSGCFHIGWDITGFHRNSDGTLTRLDDRATNTAVPAYAGTGQMYCPVREAISQNGYLAVADAELGTTTTGLGAYKINADGSLTFVQNSTVATQLTSVRGMNFDPTGQYLALAGNGGIQMYQFMPQGTFTPVGGVQQPGTNYLGVQWDGDNHLYAISNAGLHVFTNAQGVLTPASGSPHAAGAAGTLAVLPTH
jgi:6-phosphogluconolactonase (cycloisomerase 2 family)